MPGDSNECYCVLRAPRQRRSKGSREILADGRIRRATLATGQMANMGMAAWCRYTGDTSVFYSADVDPLLDTRVYLLHAMTDLLEPARRVQAMGGIVIPQHTVLAGPHQAGRSKCGPTI